MGSGGGRWEQGAADGGELDRRSRGGAGKREGSVQGSGRWKQGAEACLRLSWLLFSFSFSFSISFLISKLKSI
jgi:hypothetical protein